MRGGVALYVSVCVRVCLCRSETHSPTVCSEVRGYAGLPLCWCSYHSLLSGSSNKMASSWRAGVCECLHWLPWCHPWFIVANRSVQAVQKKADDHGYCQNNGYIVSDKYTLDIKYFSRGGGQHHSGILTAFWRCNLKSNNRYYSFSASLKHRCKKQIIRLVLQMYSISISVLEVANKLDYNRPFKTKCNIHTELKKNTLWHWWNCI